MSKLGYFLGGALAGVIGTAIAAYAVDACTSSSTEGTLDQGIEEPASSLEEESVITAETQAENGNEEPCPA